MIMIEAYLICSAFQEGWCPKQLRGLGQQQHWQTQQEQQQGQL